MVKNIFSNLSRGVFYTIGKIIAYIIIGFIIGYLLSKIDINAIDLRTIVRGVYV